MKRKLFGFAALVFFLVCIFLFSTLTIQICFAKNKTHILSVDHYVNHISTVPAIEGEEVQLYVRERVLAGIAKTFRSIKGSRKVVLFVHGATIPAVVGFDLPYENYSWMAYLAQHGFDVFCMEMTGYGWSTRPAPMDDPCNLSPQEQALIGIDPACEPSYSYTLNTLQSDWDDLNTVVDYLRELRGVDRVNLIGWSLGGPRVGGYATLYPDKVDKVVLLAPAYWNAPQPPNLPLPGPPVRLVGFPVWPSLCEDQVDTNIFGVIREEMLKTDPLGATWGPGVVRAPRYAYWGYDATEIQAPTLIMVGEFDFILSMGLNLYEDLETEHKVLLFAECSAHTFPWETRHEILYKGSKHWLLHGSIRGVSHGVFHIDADGHYFLEE